MRTAIFIALLLFSSEVYGQDPFADIQAALLSAAAKEAAMIRAGGVALHSGGVPVNQPVVSERQRSTTGNESRENRRPIGVPEHGPRTVPVVARYALTTGLGGLHRFAMPPRYALSWVQQLKPIIGPIFDMHSVPREFLAVGLVESAFRTDAVSSAGAVGMWQFMESTARRFGLIDRAGDHRADLIRSTHAAAQYLDFLLTRYADWSLALAAYNAGEERVDRAIAVAGSRNFAEIARRRLLPTETLNYVPAVLRSMTLARKGGL